MKAKNFPAKINARRERVLSKLSGIVAVKIKTLKDGKKDSDLLRQEKEIDILSSRISLSARDTRTKKIRSGNSRVTR